MSVLDFPVGVVANPDILAEQRWIREHGTELQQYEKQWVAVSGGRVVAFGSDPDEVDRIARERTGKSSYQIALVFIESAMAIYRIADDSSIL